MKVHELIAKLSKLDPELEVVINYDIVNRDQYYYQCVRYLTLLTNFSKDNDGLQCPVMFAENDELDNFVIIT